MEQTEVLGKIRAKYAVQLAKMVCPEDLKRQVKIAESYRDFTLNELRKLARQTKAANIPIELDEDKVASLVRYCFPRFSKEAHTKLANVLSVEDFGFVNELKQAGKLDVLDNVMSHMGLQNDVRTAAVLTLLGDEVLTKLADWAKTRVSDKELSKDQTKKKVAAPKEEEPEEEPEEPSEEEDDEGDEGDEGDEFGDDLGEEDLGDLSNEDGVGGGDIGADFAAPEDNDFGDVSPVMDDMEELKEDVAEIGEEVHEISEDIQEFKEMGEGALQNPKIVENLKENEEPEVETEMELEAEEEPEMHEPPKMTASMRNKAKQPMGCMKKVAHIDKLASKVREVMAVNSIQTDEMAQLFGVPYPDVNSMLSGPKN